MMLKSKQNGFTLIEAIVSAALFAFFITSVIGVFLSVMRLDSRTRAQRAVADNARFIMEFLAKEIRNGHIDYNSSECGGTVANVTKLCILNQNNEHEYITAASISGLASAQGTDLVISKSAGIPSNLNSTSVKITKLKFLVAPINEPLLPSSLNISNEQPRVTIIMELTALSTKDPVKMNIQTTLSENYYPSRQ